MHVSRNDSLYNIITPTPGDNMTHQEQIDVILQVIKSCTTLDQLKVLSKFHGGIPELRMAINERACEINR